MAVVDLMQKTSCCTGIRVNEIEAEERTNSIMLSMLQAEQAESWYKS